MQLCYSVITLYRHWHRRGERQRWRQPVSGGSAAVSFREVVTLRPPFPPPVSHASPSAAVPPAFISPPGTEWVCGTLSIAAAAVGKLAMKARGEISAIGKACKLRGEVEWASLTVCVPSTYQGPRVLYSTRQHNNERNLSTLGLRQFQFQRIEIGLSWVWTVLHIAG